MYGSKVSQYSPCYQCSDQLIARAGLVRTHNLIKGLIIYLFIYLSIYTIFQEGDIFSSTASLPYGPLNIQLNMETNKR